MKTYIIKLQNPFREFATAIYVEKAIDDVLYYGVDISTAKHYTDRNILRKHMNRVATEFMRQLGYRRSTNPKAITVNE